MSSLGNLVDGDVWKTTLVNPIKTVTADKGSENQPKSNTTAGTGKESQNQTPKSDSTKQVKTKNQLINQLKVVKLLALKLQLRAKVILVTLQVLKLVQLPTLTMVKLLTAQPLVTPPTVQPKVLLTTVKPLMAQLPQLVLQPTTMVLKTQPTQTTLLLTTTLVQTILQPLLANNQQTTTQTQPAQLL